MGRFLSTFQVELNAIDRCALLNLAKRYSKQSIAILSDSQSAIKALSSSVNSFRAEWKCHLKLNRLGTNNKVSLI